MADGKKPRIDTGALLDRLDIVQVIDERVPLIKAGAEYHACCPFHTEKTPSFTVSPAKQFYHCFGCGAHGNAIGFLMAYDGLGFVEACEALGTATALHPSPPERVAALEKGKKRSPWMPTLPAPLDTPAPLAHTKRGRPQMTWCYRNGEGQVLGHVYRFVTSDGGKELLPLVWATHGETGEQEWRWMVFPEPRPLYGLDRLAARPDAVVIVNEGEKCADVAHVHLPDLVSVSWAGGCKAVKKSDWRVLAGRDVIINPDADAKRVPLSKAEAAAGVDPASKPYLPQNEQPGQAAALEIAGILLGLGCKVWVVKLPALGEKLDGWDIADAVEEGLTGEPLADYMRAHCRLHAPAGVGGGDISALPDEQYTHDGACAGEDYGESEGTPWRRKLLRRDGRLEECRENVYMILRNHPAWAGVLWADEFARKIVKRKPAPWESTDDFREGVEWDEDETLRLGLWLAQNMSMIVKSIDTLHKTICWVARESRYNPVRDYLDERVWDGVERSKHWLTDFLGVKPTEYTALSGQMALIALVARIYEPGCQMRTMPILEGVQYRGKSAALRVLGGRWYGDAQMDLNNKDCYQLIQGKWVYEIAELDAFNRADTRRMKGFISIQEDRFRAPYDMAPKDYPRHTCFFGTTNQDEYFKDATGNTRYVPWRVEEESPINIEGLAAARDQLFAEAVHLYRAGVRWHPSRDEQIRLFEPEQAEREIPDPWESRIRNWLDREGVIRVTTLEIITDCLKIEIGKIDSAQQMVTRVGNSMKRIKWLKKRETTGHREYYYARPDGWVSGVIVAQGVEGDIDVGF